MVDLLLVRSYDLTLSQIDTTFILDVSLVLNAGCYNNSMKFCACNSLCQRRLFNKLQKRKHIQLKLDIKGLAFQCQVSF